VEIQAFSPIPDIRKETVRGVFAVIYTRCREEHIRELMGKQTKRIRSYFLFIYFFFCRAFTRTRTPQTFKRLAKLGLFAISGHKKYRVRLSAYRSVLLHVRPPQSSVSAVCDRYGFVGRRFKFSALV